MNPILWLEERLDKGRWIRRLYLVGAFILNAQTLLWAQRFADMSLRDGVQIAAIVTAVAAIPGAVMAHAFTIYSKSRS